MDLIDKILLVLQGATALSPSQLLGLVLLFMVGAFIYDRKKQSKEEDNDTKVLAALTRMADHQEKSSKELVKDLREQLNEQRSIVADLKHELDKAKEQVTLLELKVTQQAGDLKLFTQDRERLETINKQLEQQLIEKGEALDRALKILDEMRKQAERREIKICELTDNNADLKREISELKAEIDSIKLGFAEQIKRLTNERDELKTKLAANTGQMTRLKNRLTEIEKLERVKPEEKKKDKAA